MTGIHHGKLHWGEDHDYLARESGEFGARIFLMTRLDEGQFELSIDGNVIFRGQKFECFRRAEEEART